MIEFDVPNIYSSGPMHETTADDNFECYINYESW